MPKRTLEKGRFYHVYNRGHNKQQLFFDQQDYERFYHNIPLYKKKYPHTHIHAWCILPNHFHFLLSEPSSNSNPGWVSGEPGFESEGLEEANISNFMNRIQQSYAAFFNSKYRETIKKGLKAPVFEGRFKAKIVEEDDYLYQLKQYIECNAVKHEIVEKPEEWEYSSYYPDLSMEWHQKDEFDPYFE
jgi:putative transposase